MAFSIDSLISKSSDVVTSSLTKQSNRAVTNGINSVISDVNSKTGNALAKVIAKGSNQLLEKIGIDSLFGDELRGLVSGVSGDVLRSASNAAKDIFGDIVNGTLTTAGMQKFSTVEGVKAALKSKQPGSFDYKTANNINSLNAAVTATKKITDKSTPLVVDNFDSPYAVDFADTFTPKLEFMFVVEFVFNSPFNNDITLLPKSVENFQTVVHKFERPKIEIEHEDVNLYNFQTQVPKHVRYNPVTISVHDDIKNSALSALVGYLQAISPIFGLGEFNTVYEGLEGHEFGGMSFEHGRYSGALGTISQGGSKYQAAGMSASEHSHLTSIFNSIKVYHVHKFGELVDVYSFFNPKITNIVLDELDMSTNRGNGITFEIAYDRVYIDLNRAPVGDGIPAFSELTPDAKYDMINRNIAKANADKMQMEQAAIVENERRSKQAVKDQLARENNEFNTIKTPPGLNDAQTEQYIRDQQYAQSIGLSNNSQTLPSRSTTHVVQGFQSGVPGMGFEFS